MTTKYHISNFGSFSDGIPTDQDGYVFLTATGWLCDAKIDWGPDEITDEDDAEERDAKLEYQRERCEEMASEAIEATSKAEADLAEWQRGN